MGQCPIHHKDFVMGKFGAYCPTPMGEDPYTHKKLWCKEKPQLTDQSAPATSMYKPRETVARETITREPVVETKPNWNEIKSMEADNMMRMSALKAASEVVSAYLSRPDAKIPESITKFLLDLSDRNLLWLKTLNQKETPVQSKTVEEMSNEEIEELF